MRGGFRELVNPGSLVSELDLDATREAREVLSGQVRLRQRLARLLTETPVDEGVVEVTPEFAVVEPVVPCEEGADESTEVAAGELSSGLAEEMVAWAQETLGRPGPEAA